MILQYVRPLHTGFKVKANTNQMKKSAGKQEEYKVKLADEKYPDAPKS